MVSHKSRIASILAHRSIQHFVIYTRGAIIGSESASGTESRLMIARKAEIVCTVESIPTVSFTLSIF